MIFILYVLKEGEKGVGSDRKQEASGGAALDDAYKDEIKESLNASKSGDSKVEGEEGNKEQAKTFRKPVMLKNSMNPSMPDTRECSFEIPKG